VKEASKMAGQANSVEPKNVTVIRAWDGMVITAWWDLEAVQAGANWLNIRAYRSRDNGMDASEKTIRLQREEAIKLTEVIRG
jgi:hypothetical protein